MAEVNAEISKSIETIRKAIYGKDVREAIAHGIELCYSYVGGQEALNAASQAQAAVNQLQGVVDGSSQALERLNQAVDDVGELVIVSDTQPTNPENRIWIKPQADQEYKVATFDAYAELWNHVDDLASVYEQGHGGIKSITIDQNYADEDEEDFEFEQRLKRRYVITYSDNSTSDFYITNGARGPVGPPDPIVDMTIEYVKGETSNGQLVKTPPVTGWSATLPVLNPGDWLWTRTNNIFESGGISYIYAVSRQGLNGEGSMNSIRLGDNGEAMTGDATIPVDATPTENSSNIVLSGAIYNAINSALNGVKSNTNLIGTPTAPTAAPGTNTTQIATTEFVNSAVLNSQINTATLFNNPNFTGTPTAPTAAKGTKTTQIATTEFVQNAASDAAINVLAGIHVYAIRESSNSSKNIYIGVPPGTRHFVILSSSGSTNSAAFIVNCNNSGGLGLVTLGAGSKLTFTPNNSSTTDCGLKISVSAAEVECTIFDFVLYHNSKTPTWDDARIKTAIASAQAYL